MTWNRTKGGFQVSRTFVVKLEDEYLSEAEARYGLKNIGYEIGKAFKANLKRIRNIEAAKEAKRKGKE